MGIPVRGFRDQATRLARVYGPRPAVSAGVPRAGTLAAAGVDEGGTPGAPLLYLRLNYKIETENDEAPWQARLLPRALGDGAYLVDLRA